MSLDHKRMDEKCYSHSDDSRYGLEEHLAFLAKDNADVQVLYSIWVLDKGRISTRISHTPAPFLTYSDHGTGHSDNIIANIERVLGDRVAALGAADTWMLLECAYRHDIGMFISYQDMTQRATSASFIRELKDMRNSRNSDIRDAAFYLLENRTMLLNEANFSEKNWLNWTLRTERSIMLILGELFRKEHGANSRNHFELDWECGKHPEIPMRIWKIMGCICQGHTEDRKWILNELKRSEKSTLIKNFHPRMIEVLLRVGDLLDVDNNRFNTYQLSLWGSDDDQPIISKVHRIKHQALTHLYISPEHIELKTSFGNDWPNERGEDGKLYRDDRAKWEDARIKKEEEYKNFTEEQIIRSLRESPAFSADKTTRVPRVDEEELIQRRACIEAYGWNHWLEEELNHWALHWAQIMPTGFPGSVPRLTENEILWQGQLLDMKTFDLHYTISHRRATEIIDGVGLYGDVDRMVGWHPTSKRSNSTRDSRISGRSDGAPSKQLVFIRELVQNAMDATKLQLFRYLREGRYGNPIEFGNDPKKWDVLKVLTAVDSFLERMKVKVRILYFTDDQSVSVEVEDVGAGIDCNALQKMSRIGSARNAALDDEINQMPEWLKPNGSFGIGMQSVFGVVKEFRGLSTSRHERKSRNLYFQSARTDGGIFAIERPERAMPGMKFGTTITVDISKQQQKEARILYSDPLDPLDNHCTAIFDAFQDQIDIMLAPDVLPIEISYWINNIQVKKRKCKKDSAFDKFLKAMKNETVVEKGSIKAVFASLQPVTKDQSETKHIIYDNELNLMLEMSPAEHIDVNNLFGKTSFSYRGNSVILVRVYEKLRYPCWDINASLWSGKTEDMLSISRNMLGTGLSSSISVEDDVYDKLLTLADQALSIFYDQMAANNCELVGKLFARQEYQEMLEANIFSLFLHKQMLCSRGNEFHAVENCTKLLEWIRDHNQRSFNAEWPIIRIVYSTTQRDTVAALDFMLSDQQDLWMIHKNDAFIIDRRVELLETRAFPELIHTKKLYIDYFTDVLRKRHCPIHMRRLSVVRIWDDGEYQDLSIYTPCPEQQSFVQMGSEMDMIWIDSILRNENLTGRLAVPGYRLFSELSVDTIPKGMALYCIMAAGCFLIMPICNETAREYNQECKCIRRDIDANKNDASSSTMIDEYLAEKKEILCEKLVDLLEKPGREHDAFENLVNYVYQHGVITRQKRLYGAITKEEISRKYMELTRYIFNLIWKNAGL